MQKAITYDDYDKQKKKTLKENPKAVKNVRLTKKKAALATSHESSTARPAVLSDVRIIRPFTSNLMREIHGMNESNSVEAKMNNEGEENLRNQFIDLEHTSCCGKCRRGNFTKFATLERKLNRIIHLLENQKKYKMKYN